jgi:hypothetical protein
MCEYDDVKLISTRGLLSRLLTLFVLTVLTTKIRPSKPRVQEEYMASFMHVFSTNKVPRVVL